MASGLTYRTGRGHAPILPSPKMALASLLPPELPVNRPGFFGLAGRCELQAPDSAPRAPGLHARPGGSRPAGDAGIELLHGTTTLAFKWAGRRGREGDPLGAGSTLLLALAAAPTDCSSWGRRLAAVPHYQLRNKERVPGRRLLLANMVYQYKGLGLHNGHHDRGWTSGPGLYYVDSEGNRLSGTAFSVGSGSVYAYGVLDRGYAPDMPAEEAYDLARRAIYQATYRDAYSGGERKGAGRGPALATGVPRRLQRKGRGWAKCMWQGAWPIMGW
uniref:Proteasome subunit beta type-5 n=1 Tax=Chelonoidis abingdonii TaxID=106734 RepID=A0A8C0IK30_CHEAB